MKTSYHSQVLLSWYLAPVLLAVGIFLCLNITASQAQDTSVSQPDHAHHEPRVPVYQIPASVETEHRALRAELAELTHSGGKTGVAAERLQEEMQPHFVNEEKYSLPPSAYWFLCPKVK